jgi:uracil phosphoribosyltransferase
MPSAEVWHIGLYRDEKTLKPVEYYNKLPIEPRVSVCLVLDPMLATGGSAVATIDIMKRWGVKKIKFLGIIGAPEGIERMQRHHPEVPIYLAAIDEKLNQNGYILPGLGDAGDRQFGTG